MPLCDVLYARDDACVQVEVCVCIRGRSYMMYSVYCGANEVVNLTTEFFFSKKKNKNKDPILTIFLSIYLFGTTVVAFLACHIRL